MAWGPRLPASLAVFSVWMLASFLCHQLAKMALEIGDVIPSPVLASLLVTTVQTLACCFCVDFTKGPLFLVTAASHVLATWCTNASLALTFAASTMAIKMLEPISSTILQQVLISRTTLAAESLAGVVVVVVGAVLFVVGPPPGDGGAAVAVRAVVLAFVSNLALGVRNVALKLSQNQAKPTFCRSHLTVSLFFVGVLLFLLLASTILPRNAAYFLLLSAGSGACHVTYSYVSTCVVLRYVSVVGHALANILKRVLVVCLLQVSGGRAATAANWAGLVLCTAGLLLYNRRKMSGMPQVHGADASWESEGHRGASPSSNPAFHKVKGKQLACLLLPLLFVFVMCTLPAEKLPVPVTNSTGLNMTSTDTLPRDQSVLSAGKNTIQMHQNMSADRKILSKDQNVSSTNRSMLPKDQNSACSFLLGHTKLRHDALPAYNRFVTGSIASRTTEALPPGMVRSKVLPSNTQPKPKSKKDFLLNLRFNHQNWTDGKPLLFEPVRFQPELKSSASITEFLTRMNLISTPFDTDSLSPYLTSTVEVIQEAKRVHFNLFKDLFHGKKYAVLFELASHENKGDSALSAAEIQFIESMNLELLFYVDVRECGEVHYKHALSLAANHSVDEVVILLHGGGNIFGYHEVDVCRERALRLFKAYQVIIFPQSIYMRGIKSHFQFAHKLYCCNSNLTLVLRDRLSLAIARRMFTNGTRLLLAPDMAFQLGPIGRYRPPYYDVIWQKRSDTEGPQYSGKEKKPGSLFPASMSVWVWDWLKMNSLPDKNSLKLALNVLENGLSILQRGRVVVTDRLHGHVLCTLLDIPHVLLDNADHKLSAYHNTWTRGLANCRLAYNPQDAACMAQELLQQYGDSLPRRIKAVTINQRVAAKAGRKVVRTKGKVVKKAKAKKKHFFWGRR